MSALQTATRFYGRYTVAQCFQNYLLSLDDPDMQALAAATMKPEDWAILEQYLDSQMPIIKALYGEEAKLFFTLERGSETDVDTDEITQSNALCVTLHGWIRVPEAIALDEPKMDISA